MAKKKPTERETGSAAEIDSSEASRNVGARTNTDEGSSSEASGRSKLEEEQKVEGVASGDPETVRKRALDTFVLPKQQLARAGQDFDCPVHLIELYESTGRIQKTEPENGPKE
ncbi:MAG: hypothetical protein K0U98_11340 [Deltaproteobacteria bacterium]|nr:hypothetical protein [Deltaproteobacteria bacterium]